MSSIFLSNFVLVYLFALGVLFIAQSYALLYGIQILSKWNFEATSQAQYRLEKKSYLLMLIIIFSLVFHIVLLPFFTYTIDVLSLSIPGAMCAAGVLSANEYGTPILVLKLLIVFGSGIWLFVNKLDIKSIFYKYMKLKIWLFIAIYILFFIEFVLVFFYFSNMPIDPVLCCSNIYGLSGVDTSLPFGLDVKMVLVVFYLLYFLLLFSALQKYSFISFIANLFFLFISYFAVIYFFGTYVYELPTHQCPFCMLQKEYYFVGYLIWTSLFLGVFFGMSHFVLVHLTKENVDKNLRTSYFFNTIFVLLCTYFVLSYYLRNGVFL